MEFGSYTREVSAMLEILKPLIPLSLDAFSRVSQSEVATKGDGSVVTICDFALQALIINGLHQAFPDDKVLGEEDLSAVPPALLAQARTLLPDGFDVSACPGTVRDLRHHRVWVIDPIDGTQGFVTRGHFAIATALLVDRQLKCSITAWPRHSRELTGIAIDGPAIFVAVEGAGAWAIDPATGNQIRVKIPANPRNVITYSNATGRMSPTVSSVMKALALEEGVSMISMTKGFVLAGGNAKAYAKYHSNDEKAWDVAPFELFVREAGGFATTADGAPISYTDVGTVADSSRGLMFTAADPEFHQRACAALRDALKARDVKPRDVS